MKTAFEKFIDELEKKQRERDDKIIQEIERILKEQNDEILANGGEHRYETIEDIERREKEHDEFLTSRGFIIEKIITADDTDEERQAKIIHNMKAKYLNSRVTRLKFYKEKTNKSGMPHFNQVTAEALASWREGTDAGKAKVLNKHTTWDRETPRDILLYIAKNGSDELRILLKYNPSVESILDELAADPNRDIRFIAAISPFSTGPVLEKLSHDKDHDIVVAVGENPNTPLDVLYKIRTSVKNGEQIIARNHSTPVHILEELAYHPNYDIRRAVWGNSAAPKHLLTHLDKEMMPRNG